MNQDKVSPDVERRFALRRIIFLILFLLLNLLTGCTGESNIQPPSEERASSSTTETETDEFTPHPFLEKLATENALFRWSLDLEATSNGGLYPSKLDDFQMPFKDDTQEWEVYAGFITQFYEGTMLITGWDAQAKTRIGDLKSETVNQHFNVIGRVLAAEWAKDNSVRKIATLDLYTFASLLTATATEDELLEELQALATTVKLKLAT